MFDDDSMDFGGSVARDGNVTAKKSKALASMFSGGDISNQPPPPKPEVKKEEPKKEPVKKLPGIGEAKPKVEDKKKDEKKKDEKKKKEPEPKKIEMPKPKPAPKKTEMAFDDSDDDSMAFDTPAVTKTGKPLPSVAGGRKPSMAAKKNTKKSLAPV